MVSNALQILVILAQDCSEHQMECYQEPKLGGILRCILRRGRPRMCVTVIDLLYHLASSQSVISGICNNSGLYVLYSQYDKLIDCCVDNCPLLQAFEQLTNPPEPFTDIDIEYGLKVSHSDSSNNAHKCAHTHTQTHTHTHTPPLPSPIRKKM